jgi:hypothetical protein
MMNKTVKPKATKKTATKTVAPSKFKKPNRPNPGRSGPAGQKGALGATSGY